MHGIVLLHFTISEFEPMKAAYQAYLMKIDVFLYLFSLSAKYLIDVGPVE